jgi:hypothetical protein
MYRYYVLKTKKPKFTIGLDPVYGDACSAKNSGVLPLIFSTDCSPIYWLQSVLKISNRFDNLFLFSLVHEHQASRSGGGELDYM